MPLDFEAFPGLNLGALRVARANHPVDATGPAAALNTMVPSIPGVALANGALRYPLEFICWLFLPIVHPGNDIPVATALGDFIVHAQRFGVAFERCILGGLDTSACTASVARARIKRIGMRIFETDPAPFTSVFADLYPAEPSPPIAGLAQPIAVPAEASAALLLWMTSSDGTFEPLGDAEPVLLPRLLPAERVAGCGFDFFFTTATTAAMAAFPAALIAVVPVADKSRAAVDHFIAQTPDPMLADMLAQAPARMAHMKRMYVREVLDASNIDVALPHLDVISRAIQPGSTNGAEAMRMLGQIERAVLGSSGGTLATADTTNKTLHYLGPRMSRPDVTGLPSSDRTTLLLAEHATAKEREGVTGSSRAPAGSETTGTDRSGATGYPKAFNEPLRVKVNSTPFRNAVDLITRMALGVPAGPGGMPPRVEPEHPFAVLTAVFRSREIMFLHAVFEVKTMIPGVPLIQWLATNLPQHGPTWLGDLFCRCILPPGGQARTPPALDAEWNQLKAGNLLFDFETLEYRIRAHALGPTATYDVVPEAERWMSKSRLTSMTRIIPPVLDEFGYPSPAGATNTPQDLFGLASTYVDEAKGLVQTSVLKNVKVTIESVFLETSRRLASDLGANDPIRTVAGQFVINDSNAALKLIVARADVPETNRVAQILAMIPGQEGSSAHVSAEDLSTSGTAPPSESLTSDNESALRAKREADDARKSEAEKATQKKKDKEAEKAAAAKAKVGSKATHLVEYHEDGKHVLIGPKKTGTARDIVSIEKFEEVAPAGACLPVWCAKHKHPWVLCTNPKHAQHQGQTSGAHAVTANFAKTKLPLLLVTAAALGAEIPNGASPDGRVPDVRVNWHPGFDWLPGASYLAPGWGAEWRSPPATDWYTAASGDAVNETADSGVRFVDEGGAPPQRHGFGTPARLGTPSADSSRTPEQTSAALDVVATEQAGDSWGRQAEPSSPGRAMPTLRSSAVPPRPMLAPSPPPLLSAKALSSVNIWATKQSPEPTLYFHEPWLRLIAEWVKLREARLWEDSSSSLFKEGDIVIGLSAERRVAFLIVAIEKMASIGHAWERYTTELIPGEVANITSAEQANQLYQSFYAKPIYGTDRQGSPWYKPVRIMTVRAIAVAPARRVKAIDQRGQLIALDRLAVRVEARVLELARAGLAPGPRLSDLVDAVSYALRHGITEHTEVTLSHSCSRAPDFFEEAGVAPPPPAASAQTGVDPRWRSEPGASTVSVRRRILELTKGGKTVSPELAVALAQDCNFSGMVYVPRGADLLITARPRRLLHLCSGPYNSVGGVKAKLLPYGIDTVEVDKKSDPVNGDLANDNRYGELLQECRSGCYGGVATGAPCTWCSVGRIYDTHAGPPVLFDKENPEGKRARGVPVKHRAELALAVLIYRRIGTLVEAVVASGGFVISEHPSPRSDPDFLGGRLWDKSGITARHQSWWELEATRRMLQCSDAHSVTFAYCSLPGAASEGRFEQKYTTLAYSPELEPVLGALEDALCTHPARWHTRPGGREKSGAWRMSKLARWAADLIDLITRAVVSALNPHARVTTPTEPAAAAQACRHALGVPMIAIEEAAAKSVVLLPVCFDGGAIRIAFPGGGRTLAFGTGPRGGDRDACGKRAQKWCDSLFAPRVDVFAYYQTTMWESSDRPLLVVTAVVANPPPSDLEGNRVDEASQLVPSGGVHLRWASLGALDGRLYVAAGAAWECLRQFYEPTAPLMRADVTTGRLELTPVAMAGGRVRSSATKMDWKTEVVPEALAVTEQIQREITRRMQDGALPPDIREELNMWYDAVTPPAFADIGPQLRESCFRADDARLAHIPFPSHAVPVPTEPMAPPPPPPDQRRVPQWATSLEKHALLHTYARELKKARLRVHERLCHCILHKGDMTGAPPPIFFAFGPEGYQPWARKLIEEGHELYESEGRIFIRDCSGRPEPIWNVDYLDGFLQHSPNQGLRSGVKQGFSYLSDRGPFTVCQDHLLSIYHRGLDSVLKEMTRLTSLKRYTQEEFENGFRITSLPRSWGANGTVPRPSELWRDRRIVDGMAPRRLRYTHDKKTVVPSIGGSCGWHESKRMHREFDTRGTWLRHSPAFHKQPLASLRNGPAAQLTATSKTPSQVEAAARASGASPAEVARACEQHAARPRHARELKWLFTDVMLAVCIMSHAALLLGEPLTCFEDDEADCFFQFITSLVSRRDAFIALIDPAAMLNGDWPPAMVDFNECCLSMGMPPSSGWAQAFNTELGEEFERLCARKDESIIEALAGSNQKFGEFVEIRKKLSEHTGRNELALVKSFWYTDDPANLVVGVKRGVEALVTWTEHLGPRGANVVMGKPIKRRVSVDLGWIGGKCLLTGLLGYIGDAKQAKTLDGIEAALGGKLTLELYEKLAGLLNHLVCLLCMPYTIMYGIYEVHDRARELRLSGSDPAPITPNAESSLKEWHAAVASRAGTSALAAAFDTATPPAGVAVRRMFSDSARPSTLEGDVTEPAIVGNMYERVWLIRLGEAELELPVIVTEFFGGIFNLIIFYPFLRGSSLTDQAPIALIIDSLVVPMIMASRAGHGSPMMQWMHKTLQSLPEFIALQDHLLVSHTHGPRNFVVDAGTRGRVDEMITVMRQLNLEPDWMHVPERCYRLLREGVEQWRLLNDTEKRLTAAFREQYMSDGPSSGGEPLFHRSSTPAQAAGSAHFNAARYGVAARSSQSLAASGAAPVLPAAHAPGGRAPAPSAAQSIAPPLDGRALLRTPHPQTARSHTPVPLPDSVRAPRALDDLAQSRGASDAQHLAPGWAPSTMRSAPRPPRARVPPFLTRGAQPARPGDAIAPTLAPDTFRSVAALEATRRGVQPPRAAAPVAAEGQIERAIGRARILEELQSFNIGDLSLVPLDADNEPEEDPTALMLGALARTSAEFALHPRDAGVLETMAAAVGEQLSNTYASSTREKDDGHMKKWRNVCRYFRTPALRTDAAANSGVDADGHTNECVLQAFALLAFYVDMEPRAHADADVGPDPQSAMNNLRGVHRYHEARGITMASTKLASKVLKGLMRSYVTNCGIREVRRKKPLTNAKINAMLATPDGATAHGITVVHGSYAWQATTAWVQMLAESGERKDEIAKLSRNTPFVHGRLTFASLVWRIAACGGEVPNPTAAQLALLDESAGDGVYVKHGRAKNDFFGIFFAPTPSFLPFIAHSPRNAARSLRDLEIAAAHAGLTAAQRGRTPLFGSNLGEEFSHWEVETYFEIMMRFGANVSLQELSDYSIHSFRIFVACALMAANVPRHTIKRLLRWRGDLSLEIYARLNDDEWANHVKSIYTAAVDSTVAGRLAALGTIDLEAAALRLGAAA